MNLSRRNFLIGSAATLAVAAMPKLALAVDNTSGYYDFQPLNFLNVHTNEKLVVRYRDQNGYIAGALNEVNDFFKDYRTGTQHEMDPRLLDRIYALNMRFGGKNNFELISGYRSPQTNSMLRENSHGVAKNSFHMQGKAADIRMPGQNLDEVYKVANAMGLGGTGVYHKSNFIHVDTGPVRTWHG